MTIQIQLRFIVFRGPEDSRNRNHNYVGETNVKLFNVR